MEDNDKEYVSDNISNNNISNVYINCPKPSDPRIKHDHPFYFCIEHPEFQNINLDSIMHHLEYSTEHKNENNKQRD